MDLEQIQKALEKEQVQEGIDSYRRNLEKAKDKGTEGSLKPQLNLVHTCIYQLSKEIDRRKEASKAKVFPRIPMPHALSVIKDMDTDVVSYIVCNEIINNMTQYITQQKMFNKIGSAIRDYEQFERFKVQNKGLYNYAVDKLKQSTNQGNHRRNSLRHYANYGDIFAADMGSILKLGHYFFMVFQECTDGIVELYKQYQGKRKHVMCIKPSDATLKWLEKMHSKYEILMPKYMPMVVKPYQWTNGQDGGYLTTTFPLIKYKTKEQMTEFNQKYNLSRVQKALNAIQDTPWQIDVRTLEIAQHFFDNKIESKLMPAIFNGNVPPLPCAREDIDTFKKMNPQEWQTWKNETTAYHDKVKHSASHFYLVDRQLEIANKFKDFDSIWFIFNCDFRGRIYCIQSLLNPQGNDLSKALLRFANGVPMGEHGEKWLKIHLANCYGHDKISMDDRIAWATENHESIMNVARNPLLFRDQWEDADSPWQYLSACFEYQEYIDSGLGKDFLSSLVIGQDGTCSGIQHLCALNHDESSGKLVNLTSTDKPSDIYQTVCDVVERNIKDTKDTYLTQWKGNITRKTLKSNVMTFAYGSTHQGRQNQIRDYLRKQEQKGEPVFTFPRNMSSRDRRSMEWNLVVSLAKESTKAIEEVLTAPKAMMDWLKACVKEFNAEGKAMTWLTPAGFPVVQDYKKQNMKKIDTNFDSFRMELRYKENTNKIDAKKCGLGFAPNYIHGQDSAHCMITTNRLKDLGVHHFSMVHDSFGVHAGHSQLLSDQLRLTFIELYRGYAAESLWQELQENLGRALPRPPALGNLDITRVMESDYFFN